MRGIGSAIRSRTGGDQTHSNTTGTTSGARLSHSVRVRSARNGHQRRIQPEGTAKKARWNIHGQPGGLIAIARRVDRAEDDDQPRDRRHIHRLT